MASCCPISIVNYLDNSVEKDIDNHVKHAISILRNKHYILLEEPVDKTELLASLENIKTNDKGILFITCHSNLNDGICRTQNGSGYVSWDELAGMIPDSVIIFLVSCSSQNGGSLLHESFKGKFKFVSVISTTDEVSPHDAIELIDFCLDTMHDPKTGKYSTKSYWALTEELNQKLLKDNKSHRFVIDPKDEPTC